MKKIVAIVGSPKRKSVTEGVIEALIRNIKVNSNEEIEDSIIPLANYNVRNCRGCTSCFQRADSCVINDDIRWIENEILSADMIILASPVYGHAITGLMKTFIDRISYWMHLMRLIGKYGVVVSVSDSNGNIYVDEYLTKILEFMGVSVVETFDFLSITGLEVNGYEEKISNIRHYLLGKKEILNYKLKNSIFEVYKKNYQLQYDNMFEMKEDKIISGEVRYWKESGLLDCKNFQDAFNLFYN